MDFDLWILALDCWLILFSLDILFGILSFGFQSLDFICWSCLNLRYRLLFDRFYGSDLEFWNKMLRSCLLDIVFLCWSLFSDLYYWISVLSCGLLRTFLICALFCNSNFRWQFLDLIVGSCFCFRCIFCRCLWGHAYGSQAVCIVSIYFLDFVLCWASCFESWILDIDLCILLFGSCFV